MFYYNYKPGENDYNECVSKGICSISPTISALQEVMFVMLCELSHYVTKLELMGAKNDKIKLDIAYNITYLATLQEYTDEQVLQIINTLFSNLIHTKNTYNDVCREKGLDADDITSSIKFENNMEINKLISEGDRAFRIKYKNFTKPHYAEILLSVLKSLSTLIIDLNDTGSYPQKSLDEVIKALNLYNMHEITEDKIREVIYNISDLNAELMLELNDIKIKKFGEINSVEVSHSTRKGKAIMVSGNNMSELQDVLEAVKDTDIDVYTNGNLLIAHAYSKFREYPNLCGHFGNGVETSVLDFATFPGAIMLTKNEAHNVEYLYRGRLFTTDAIPPKGVAKLSHDNLKPLIDGALDTKGFAHGQKRSSAHIGFNISDVEDKFDDIAEKLKNDTYKYLFIIGLSNHTNTQDEYFKNFFRNKPANSFVISFSYASPCDNVYTIDVANDYALTTELLFKLFERVPIDSEKITFFLTKCDSSAFAGMIRLNKRGAKNIYMSNCLPTVMNPTIVKAFKKLYNINNMKSSSYDLERITGDPL